MHVEPSVNTHDCNGKCHPDANVVGGYGSTQAAPPDSVSNANFNKNAIAKNMSAAKPTLAELVASGTKLN
jgi:hypothetical protein